MRNVKVTHIMTANDGYVALSAIRGKQPIEYKKLPPLNDFGESLVEDINLDLAKSFYLWLLGDGASNRKRGIKTNRIKVTDRYRSDDDMAKLPASPKDYSAILAVKFDVSSPRADVLKHYFPISDLVPGKGGFLESVGKSGRLSYKVVIPAGTGYMYILLPKVPFAEFDHFN